MPAQVMAVQSGDSDFPAKLTTQVILCSIIAAFAGLMFGYDIGISGGVTSMDSFLKKFFPEVYVKKHKEKNHAACLFILFIGVIFNVAAVNQAMLIIGRLCLGAGVGFGNQAVPLFISEIAPAKYRGGLNILFQMLVTVGVLIANLINYATSHHSWGRMVSLGGAAFPAIFLGLGSLLIVETPTSPIERGMKEKGLQIFKKIRGIDDIDKEYQEIVHATELAQKIKHPFRNLRKRSSRPQLVCGTIIQQLTGINVITFYAPVLFQTMGFGSDASLLSSVITGGVNVLCTLVAVFGVDKFGRRALLIEAAVQMLISQVI